METSKLLFFVCLFLTQYCNRFTNSSVLYGVKIPLRFIRAPCSLSALYHDDDCSFCMDMRYRFSNLGLVTGQPIRTVVQSNVQIKSFLYNSKMETITASCHGWCHKVVCQCPGLHLSDCYCPWGIFHSINRSTSPSVWLVASQKNLI